MSIGSSLSGFCSGTKNLVLNAGVLYCKAESTPLNPMLNEKRPMLQKSLNEILFGFERNAPKSEAPEKEKGPKEETR